MTLSQDIDNRIRRWGIVDTKLVQAAAFFLALVLAKLLPDLLDVSIWWYVVLAVGCALKPTLDFFRRRGVEDTGTSAS